MEFIYINDKSLKIIITAEELKESLLDVNTLDYSEIKTKRFFWDIMEKAYEQTGFDATDSKLYVKIFPMRDGGCEMFVAKEKIHKKVKDVNNGFIFITDDTDGLFMLCSRLKNSGFFGSSKLYCDDNAVFYLACNTENKLPSYINAKDIPVKKEYIFASEYGSVFDLDDVTSAYLDEHMTLVCEDFAIEKIIK